MSNETKVGNLIKIHTPQYIPHLIDLKLMTEHKAIDITFNFSFQVTNEIALICKRTKWIFNMHIFLFITFFLVNYH